MPKLGPYSRPKSLARMDGRSPEARLLRQTREDLVAHLGGSPSAVQMVLIERACWLSLRLSLFDRKLAEGGDLSERDGREYLAWSNSLARLLKQLGLKGAAGRPRTLQDHLASRQA